MNQRDRSLSSNQKSNNKSASKFKSFRNSVQQQKELLHQAYLADADPAQLPKEKSRKHGKYMLAPHV